MCTANIKAGSLCFPVSREELTDNLSSNHRKELNGDITSQGETFHQSPFGECIRSSFNMQQYDHNKGRWGVFC